ncbi:carboxynorspermidine decarboxylase [Alphaproteobacteria bacterium]|nr:carboxynorspermidine decarboxylase [Alphaproteobacteria bacterium]
MLQTMGGNPRSFQKLNLYSLPSPCFVIDKKALRSNLEVLQRLKVETNVKILIALKAFSNPALAPLISKYLDGCCSSGLYETRLAAKYFQGEISTFSPAFKDSEFEEIASISNHIIFNSLNQFNNFHRVAKKFNKEVGIRVNPLYSEITNPKYNSANIYSRLGIHINDLNKIDLDEIDGVHFHTLCEQNFQPLQNTWDQIKSTIIPISKKLKWINLGGGHHITREDYEMSKLKIFLKKISDETNCQIYIEPGEAVVLDSGVLIGEIVDFFKPANNLSPYIAITDISAISHIPDVIEAPYRPALLNEPEDGYEVVLGGPSCLAGDIIGKYKFKNLPLIGDRIALLDQAHYTMVKTSFFNGVKLPSIALWDSETDDIEVIKQFSFKDFENKL